MFHKRIINFVLEKTSLLLKQSYSVATNVIYKIYIIILYIY